MKTTIPIIILNYNSAKHVIGNIESALEHYDKTDIKYQFIVIDNNSQKESNSNLFEYIDKFKSIQLIFNDRYDLDKLKDIQSLKNYDLIYIQMTDNYGFSYSNNVGLRLSYKLGYKQAIISNPDTRIIDSNSIKNMLDIIVNNNNVSVVFPQVIDPNGTHQEIMYETNFYSLVVYPIFYPVLFVPTKIYRKTKLKLKTNNLYTKVYTSIGCFFIVDLEDLNKVDFLDEKIFLYAEEDILALRIKSIGKELVCANNATILHDHIILKKENPKTDKLKQDALRYLLKEYLNYSDDKLVTVNKAQNFYKKYYANTIDKIKNK